MENCTDGWVFDNSICSLEFVQCDDIPSKRTIRYSDINAVWVLTAAIIVFFMKAGFMLVEVAFANGPSDRRHVIILKHQDAFASAFAFFFIGFDIISGYESAYPKGFPYTISDPGVWFFKFTFASNAATIVGGCLVANKYKMRIPAAFISAFVISAFIHPAVARLIWSDYSTSLSPYRYCNYSEEHRDSSWETLCRQNLSPWSIKRAYVLDFAGGGAVHGIGGIVGLVLCLFAKLQEWRDKRKNVQYTLQEAEPADTVEEGTFWKWMYSNSGGNEATVEAALGVLILWFCWFAFNCGSTENMAGITIKKASEEYMKPYHRISGIVAVNMIMACASGGVVAVAIAVWAQLRYRTESVNANEIAIGILSALVSITAGCAYMNYWAAALTGAIGVVVYHLGSLFEFLLRIKDTARVFPVHGLCGIWSMIAIAIFTFDKTGECHIHDVYEHTCHCSLKLPATGPGHRLVFQIFGALIIISISVVGSFLMFFILYIIPIKPIMYIFEKLLFLNYKKQYKPLHDIYSGGLLFTTPKESNLAEWQDYERQPLVQGQTRKTTSMGLRRRRENRIGNPTDACEKDPEEKSEKIFHKIVKQGSKIATKVTKLVAKNSGLDDDTVKVIDGVANAVENQADAGRNATLADRVKMATGDTAGIVGDNVDNKYVSTAASVVKEQAKADNDTSMQQRLLKGAGTTLGGVADIVGEENEIAGAAVGVVGGVVHDQGEVNDDTSAKQRVLLAGGSALSKGGRAVGDLTGVDIAADALEVAGGVVKDQVKADKDTPWKKRAAMAVGSTAKGVAGLDSMKSNYEGKAVCWAVEKTAEEIQDDLADKKE